MAVAAHTLPNVAAAKTMYMIDAGLVVKTAGPQEGMVLKVGSLDLSLPASKRRGAK